MNVISVVLNIRKHPSCTCHALSVISYAILLYCFCSLPCQAHSLCTLMAHLPPPYASRLTLVCLSSVSISSPVLDKNSVSAATYFFTLPLSHCVPTSLYSLRLTPLSLLISSSILSIDLTSEMQLHTHNHSREDRISSVFRPSLSAPTMTLEEFGDQQKAEAEERARNEKDQESHVVKRLVIEFVWCDTRTVEQYLCVNMALF